jgi:hypothetical protein
MQSLTITKHLFINICCIISSHHAAQHRIIHHLTSSETMDIEGKSLLQPRWLTHEVKPIFDKELWKDASTIQDLWQGLWQRYFLCKIYSKTFESNNAASMEKGFFFMKREKEGKVFLAFS